MLYNETCLPTISSCDELVERIREIGFLPAFRNSIPGFSVEECIAPEFWFPDSGEGFWEWKGPAIQRSGCAYGKLLSGRAAFVTLPYYIELSNYRRAGYDFDARYEEGLARAKDKPVYDILCENHSLLSKQLSSLCCAGGGRKDFSEIMTHLQMQCYVLISNFEYALNRNGQPYGWGITRYELPEYRFGSAFTDNVYIHEPEESKQRIFEHLRSILPHTEERAIIRLIG